jgi:sugar phosphate isomerase/epimerase
MHPAVAGDWTFLTSLDAALATIDEVGTPALKVCFDTYHLGQDETVLQRIPQVVPHLALVQLGDAKSPPQEEPHRCPLGEGFIPLRDLMRAFQQSGYRGFFEVELMGEEIEAADYRDLLRQTRATFDRLTQ